MSSTNDLGHPRLFIFAALTITSVCIAIVHSSLFLRNPDVAAWGVTFDLIITLPLAYYLLVVHRGRVGIASMLPVVAVCGLLARHIVPSGQQQFLHQLAIVISAPLELLAVGWLILRVRSAGRLLTGDDFLNRLRDAALELTRNRVVAEVLAGEVAMWYFALFSWRRRRVVRAEESAITVHEVGGWSVLLVALFIVLTGEATAMHLIVQQWSRVAAWTLTSLEAYSVLWLIADFRALGLRPTLIDSTSIRVRLGLRWSVDVQRVNIASLRRIQGAGKRPDLLKVAVVAEPTHLLTLHEPVSATAMFGIRRQVRELAFAPDDAASFERALNWPQSNP